MKDKEKTQAEKRMKKFVAKYLKLMAEFPEMTLSGDMNGHINVNSYYGNVGGQYLYKTLPSFVVLETKTK